MSLWLLYWARWAIEWGTAVEAERGWYILWLWEQLGNFVFGA